uniref:Transposase n=1 Tax=Angiostrongylus cantonensis TaxID=6313 RepID=A0A0K0CTN2_ANGCA
MQRSRHADGAQLVRQDPQTHPRRTFATYDHCIAPLI